MVMIPNVIPSPKKYEISQKICLIRCSIFTEEADFLPCCDLFSRLYQTLYCTVPLREPGGIHLFRDSSLAPGSYRLTSGEDIKVYAADADGMFYALASLIQLTVYDNHRIEIPELEIEDSPDKDYRSLMVDLAREWHPFPKLMKFVDICFFFKIKYLHLHFIDGLRYTLPSRAFPRLPSENEHYTFEQIAQLNAYAKARGVILVPEYECPGHSMHIADTYPEVFADHAGGKPLGNRYSETGKLIAYRNIMCASSPASLNGSKALLKEIADMFPDSPYIHIGGDEAEIRLWEECDDCTRYMQENGIEDVSELYSKFVGEIASYVLSLGRTPIVWEGFPKKGHAHIPKETIVVAWESYYHMVYDLLEEGFRVINASWSPLYIVPSFTTRWSPFDILKWNVHRWQHWWPKSEAYLNPITVTDTERVLGAALCCWEQSFEQEINAIMENIAAVAERTWNVQRRVSDEEYNELYQGQRKTLARIIQDR